MPPTLGRLFPPDWQGHPPHMSARDFQLWRRFQALQPTLATGYYFDVALGNGDPHTEGASPDTVEMWARLTRFRADALADTGAGWILIELRESAGAGALGALLTYAHLWTADPPDTRPTALWLVTNHLHPDLHTILDAYAITLKIV
jgi:hypothetical protein